MAWTISIKLTLASTEVGVESRAELGNIRYHAVLYHYFMGVGLDRGRGGLSAAI